VIFVVKFLDSNFFFRALNTGHPCYSFPFDAHPINTHAQIGMPSQLTLSVAFESPSVEFGKAVACVGIHASLFKSDEVQRNTLKLIDEHMTTKFLTAQNVKVKLFNYLFSS
jgi:hypothetical protein